MTVQFKPFELPIFPVPTFVPELPDHVFSSRASRLEKARIDAGFDAILMYADREHAANFEWRTGFSPRFEEALWLEIAGQKRTVLVGNENLDFARQRLRVEANVVLYQNFSLADQPRDSNIDLEACLRAAGLEPGMRVGLIGWKPMRMLDAPHWIVQAIHSVTNLEPENATHLLMDAGHGLRVVLEPEMIQFLEYAARLTSNSVRDWVNALEPGLSERDAAKHFNSFGLELGCHPMSNFSSRIESGVGSPRNRKAERGGYAQGAFCTVGSLTCRAGRLVSSTDADQDDYLEITQNYLEVVRSWYASLHVGAIGGEFFAATNAAKNSSWDLALNPGHLIHLDEWVSSPFYAGSSIALRSGIAIQQDLIPVPRQGGASLNMEDGLVLADADLRGHLERLDPALMQRCQTRRDWMMQLGYELHEDVLPLSDMAGVFFPFLLEPSLVAHFS